MSTRREEVNRYLDASRSHSALVAAALNQRFLLGIVVLLSLILALVGLGGALQLAGQSKLEPYVFVLEKSTGLSWALGKAERLFDSDDSLRAKVDQAALFAFFDSLRLVTPDAWQQDQAIKKVYSMVDEADPARRQLDTFYKSQGNSPVELAQSIMRHNQPISLLPVTQTTWQYDWIEVVTNRDGSSRAESRKRATAEVYHREPTSETTVAEHRANPSALFVKSFHIVQLERAP